MVMEITHMGSREARSKFADILGRVHYKGESIIIERSGKPMVAVIPLDLFEQIIAEREVPSAEIESMQAGTPEMSEEVDFIEPQIEVMRQALNSNNSNPLSRSRHSKG